MKTQMSPIPGASAETNGPAQSAALSQQPAWQKSIWFSLALSIIAGFLYALFVMGARPLNPRNITWIAYDPAYHYIGWEMLRQDPHLHWPLTYTERLGYPKGESAALEDLNPLLAVVLRPFSFLMPEPAQYFGLEVILVCTLQFFFAFRLFRLLFASRCAGNSIDLSVPSSPAWDIAGAAICSAFFLLAPPLNYRFWGHYSLSNQWVLVAALFVLAQAQEESSRAVRRFVISAAVLTGIAVGVNPYLAFQVLLLLIAGVATLLWRKRIGLAQSAGVLALLMAIGFAMAYSLGLVISGGKGYASGGYRDLSMNLLAPFDPRGWTSPLFPRLHSASPGQYEGYNYFGAGVLILAAVLVLAATIRRRRLPRLDKRWFLPLALCCLLLTLLALSTRITLGSRTLLDLDPNEIFSSLFAPLRATGRLFWAPYYVILAAIVAAPFFLLRRPWATLLVAGLLVLQFADTASLRRWVRTTISEDHPSPLRSPIWSQLGAQHQNLIVLPAWQCAHNASPGSTEGYRIFGFLAIQQKMRINSYQSARYTGVAEDYHCTEALAELSQKGLSPDSAYVVMPDVAAAIAQGPTGAGSCHDLDHFILCSTKTGFGLSPVLMTQDEREANAVANSGFEDGDTAPWSTNGLKAAISAATARTGSHSLAETGDSGTVFQDINGLQPGGTYSMSAWVSCSPGSAITAQLLIFNPTSNGVTQSRVINCNPGWQLLTRSFTVGAEGAIRIHLARGLGEGTLYWDDVQIAREKGLP